MTQEEKKQLEFLQDLKNRAAVLSSKTVTLGFDAFIDSIVRVVKYKDTQSRNTYFETIHSFGEYVIDKGEKSFSIEMEELTTKLGGNMPITANAIANLGAKVSCIGPLGYPEIHPVFRQMPPHSHLHSFADPGLTKILEFQNGKIMMAEMGHHNKITWEFIRDTIGKATFVELFNQSDLITILNWSELDNSSMIWKGLLNDILPTSTPEKKPIGFFDLSDCSKRSNESIREAMNLLHEFSFYWDVVLSLNLNEATLIHAALTGKKEKDVEEMCEAIYSSLNIHTVIIHSPKQSVARDTVLHRQKSFFIKNPVLSSGAGDNFNAGYCIGKLMGLGTDASLIIGHATSTLYMQSGYSPTVAAVADFLANQETQR